MRLIVICIGCICVSCLFMLSCDDGCDLDNDYDAEWQQTSLYSVPYPDVGMAVAYDETRQKLVVFGGSFVNNTWIYDGQSWQFLVTNHSPPPLEFAAACYHPGLQGIVLFGGITSYFDYSNRLWLFDGQDWSDITPDVSPPCRAEAALCYDSDRYRLILYGGYDKGISLRDTWEWSNGSWLEIKTNNDPNNRWRPGMVYDPNQGRIVLFGGRKTSDDTWFYQNNEWWPIETEHFPPSRYCPGMCYDRQTGTIVLVGGNAQFDEQYHFSDFWRFNGSDWTRNSDFSNTDNFANASLFQTSNNNLILYTSSYANDFTRLYAINNFEAIMLTYQDCPQPQRYHNPIIFDLHRDIFYLLVYNDANHGTSMWEYDNDIWRLSQVPPPVQSYSYANSVCSFFEYDVNRKKLLFIPRQYSQQFIIMELEDDRWSTKSFENGPKALLGYAHAYDIDRGVLVLFGGDSSITFTDETWEYNGDVWQQIKTETSPYPRSFATMAYNPDRKIVVLYGSGGYYGSSFNYRDTWEYDGVTWTFIEASTGPETNGPMVFHRGLDKIVMYAGQGKDYQDKSRTYIYDGQPWQQLQTRTGPGDRIGATFAYDPHQDRIVLFGGKVSNWNDYPQELSDTWEFSK